MNDMMKNLQRMTSLEIAQVTGKPHNDVLKAVRKMEPAWAKITQGKFSLSNYQDATGRTLPCYALTKTECLYVATKFNDAARARLVLRWEELEHARLTQPTAKARALLVTEKEILSQGDRIRRQTIGRENAAADGCHTHQQRIPLLQPQQGRGRRQGLQPPDGLCGRRALHRTGAGRALRRHTTRQDGRGACRLRRDHHREEPQHLLAALRRQTERQPPQGNHDREAMSTQKSLLCNREAISVKTIVKRLAYTCVREPFFVPLQYHSEEW